MLSYMVCSIEQINAELTRKLQVSCNMFVRLALMPRTRCCANQLLINLVLQKALNRGSQRNKNE